MSAHYEVILKAIAFPAAIVGLLTALQTLSRGGRRRSRLLSQAAVVKAMKDIAPDALVTERMQGTAVRYAAELQATHELGSQRLRLQLLSACISVVSGLAVLGWFVDRQTDRQGLTILSVAVIFSISCAALTIAERLLYLGDIRIKIDLLCRTSEKTKINPSPSPSRSAPPDLHNSRGGCL